jgi:hypothetical protein
MKKNEVASSDNQKLYSEFQKTLKNESLTNHSMMSSVTNARGRNSQLKQQRSASFIKQDHLTPTYTFTNSNIDFENKSSAPSFRNEEISTRRSKNSQKSLF